MGILGIALGALAFWLALPPIATTAVLLPVFFGMLAVAAGIWAITRGEKRVGWGAVAAGIFGVGLGYLATRSGRTNLDETVVWSALLASMLRYATPLTFAAIGGMFS